MIVRVHAPVFEDIRDAVIYSDEHFGLSAAEKLNDHLHDALDRVASDYGKQVLDAPANYRYLSVNPYNLYYRRDERAGEAVVYLLRH